MLQDGVKLTQDEAKVAAESVHDGHEVIAKRPLRVGRSADFTIDAKPTELKTIAHVKSGVGEAVTRTIVKASAQAKNVVIDTRGQAGFTESQARASVDRAVRSLAKSRLEQIQFIGREGNRIYEVTVRK